MGDRSPKSTQKHAAQKQSKTDGMNQKKNALIMSQQATKAKAAAACKKRYAAASFNNSIFNQTLSWQKHRIPRNSPANSR